MNFGRYKHSVHIMNFTVKHYGTLESCAVILEREGEEGIVAAKTLGQRLRESVAC